MSEGNVLYTHCDPCGEETPHRILKGSLGPLDEKGFDGTVQCIVCKNTHHANIPVERPVKVKAVISQGSRSRTDNVEFGPFEVMKVGDEFYWKEHNLKITSIEKEGSRVDCSKADEADVIWAVEYDTVDVKVSIVKGANTASERATANPEEEFSVGSILEFGNQKVMIGKIKTGEGMVYREGRPIEARDIKRIYCRKVKEHHRR